MFFYKNLTFFKHIALKKLNIILPFLIILFFYSCSAFKFQKVDTSVPMSGEERARKNINEGRGISLSKLSNSKTTYEFSTSNPMWRATFDILDFMPFSTVDYSGGLIISDWYSDNQNKNEYIKITVRFLNNEIKSDSLKIIVHQKICDKNNNCTIKLLKSNLSEELSRSILKTASLLDKNTKK